MNGIYYVKGVVISTGETCTSSMYSGTYSECERWIAEEIRGESPAMRKFRRWEIRPI